MGTEIRTVDFWKLNMEGGQDNPTFPEGPDSLRNHTKSKKKNRWQYVSKKSLEGVLLIKWYEYKIPPKEEKRYAATENIT